jgi:hypothetical protein
MVTLAIGALAVIATVTLPLWGVDARGATRLLTAQGFAQIEPTGYRWLACSKDDVYATGFRATSPSGVRVSGAVCRGVFKGATIRFD